LGVPLPVDPLSLKVERKDWPEAGGLYASIFSKQKRIYAAIPNAAKFHQQNIIYYEHCLLPVILDNKEIEISKKMSFFLSKIVFPKTTEHEQKNSRQ
jgi:hypothetical protein